MSLWNPFGSLSAGTELVYELASYYFSRRTPDGRIMAMASDGAYLMVPDDQTGIPAFPTVATARRAMSDRQLFIRSDPIGDDVRDDARREETTPTEVERCDSWAPLRRKVTKAWDSLPHEEKPMRSDAGLREWLRQTFDAEEMQARHGRLPCGATIRTWINSRGTKGDRRMSDMQSRSGRVRRARRLNPAAIDIAKLHALAKAKRKGRTLKQGHMLYKRDVERFNDGQEVVVDGVSLARSPVEASVKPMSAESFRLECHMAIKAETDEAAWGSKGRRARYCGGGKAMEPSRFLEIVEQDSTPFPKWFLIDVERRVPVGVPNVTFTMDVFTRCFIGWDVTYEDPSLSSWMRSLAHCATPKIVPERLRDEFPGLADIFGYITGAVVYDNASEYISKAVEDAGGDLCHEVRLAGEGEPTHKAHVERGHRTVISKMGEVPGSTFSIERLRRFGYDPDKHAIITIEEFRVLLAEAIATYHTQSCEALNGRVPLDVWQEQMSLHGLSQARDVDQFLRSIGNVAFVRFGRAGCLANRGLRYSGDSGRRTGNEELLADLASALGPSKDDDPSFRVKIKTYSDDLGFISVWNPLSRRYLNIDCTTQRYAAGRPLWLHERTIEHAKMVRAEFITEEQMLRSATGLTDEIEATAPEAAARERKLMARLVDTPNVRRYLGDTVDVIRIQPSPSGLETTIEHDIRATVRKDAMVEPQRRQRGGTDARRTRQKGAGNAEAGGRTSRAAAQPTSAERKRTRPRKATDARAKQNTKRTIAAAPLAAGKFS